MESKKDGQTFFPNIVVIENFDFHIFQFNIDFVTLGSFLRFPDYF